MSLLLLLVPFQPVICGVRWILLWFCTNLATWCAGPWPSGRFSHASPYQWLSLGILTEAWQGTFHLLSLYRTENRNWPLEHPCFFFYFCRLALQGDFRADFLKHLRNSPLHSEVNAFFGESISDYSPWPCPHAAEALAVALW